MKKLIGIILAVCMLGTIAFATDAAVSPITGTATPVEPDATTGITGYSIAVSYSGLASTAQATMLAYDVTSKGEAATANTAYENQTNTPIVGIDQEPADNTFEIKLPDTFMDSIAAGASRKIVVKVGGTDVNVPMSWLVTFTKAAVTPGPGEGGEGGGETPVDPPVNPPVNPDEIEITVLYGDVNGDGAINNGDAGLILQLYVGIIDGFVDQEKRPMPNTVGDVNGDGAVNNGDAGLVLQKYVGILDGFVDQNKNPLTTYTYKYVVPAE